MSDICLKCGTPKPESSDDLCQSCLRDDDDIHLCDACGEEFEPYESGDDDHCEPCAAERDDTARLRGGLYRSAP